MIWEIDPAHSQVSFALRVMSLATTRGRFNRLPDAHGALQSLWLLGGGGDSIRSSTAWLCLPSQTL